MKWPMGIDHVTLKVKLVTPIRLVERNISKTAGNAI